MYLNQMYIFVFYFYEIQYLLGMLGMLVEVDILYVEDIYFEDRLVEVGRLELEDMPVEVDRLELEDILVMVGKEVEVDLEDTP